MFKNYDHDRDGFISHDEFDSIAGNFPFIDSFCVLDADKFVTSSQLPVYSSLNIVVVKTGTA